MSQKELRRVEVLARVKRRELKVVDAASLVEVSYRQAKRLWKRYREEGAAGLQHRSAGRSSNRAYDEKFRQQVLRRVRDKYGGAVGERFGPTLAAEHLESEDRLQVHAETLRRWMLAEGLWSRERKRRRHLRRRERKEHFGEMVQMDGSFHAWLEERGPRGCLIDLVDDATSTTWAQLGEQETIWAVADALRAWIERYGVPQSVYVDWKNLYKRVATVKEQLRGEEPVTQFGRMCAKLGIAVIAASSPQAKGRVERQHGTHQDRLVKKLRRKEIANHEAANVYLETEYLVEHNRRFARAAAKGEDYHRRAPRAAELDRIFRLENERTISNDGVLRYQNRWLQLVPQSRQSASAQDKVLVYEGRHGNLAIEYRGRTLRWQEIPAPRPPIERERKPAGKPAPEPPPPQVQRKWVPPSNHPWREAARRGERQRARKLAAMAARPSSAWPSAPP
ncbi:MAG TPA: ISNCY family transposase [Candidatus Dormibacteraeota bacterium]|nr:ISNCY family transposase [Candidatus Dormibacteraeota bacterium]